MSGRPINYSNGLDLDWNRQSSRLEKLSDNTGCMYIQKVIINKVSPSYGSFGGMGKLRQVSEVSESFGSFEIAQTET